MKTFEEIKTNEKFWIPDIGLVTKDTENTFDKDGISYKKESAYDHKGVFRYFSEKWWSINKIYFEYKTFIIGRKAFSIDGSFINITNIKDGKIYIDKLILHNFEKENNSWFTNIKNIKNSHKIYLGEYLTFNIHILPKQYIDESKYAKNLIKSIVNFRAENKNKTLLE